MGPRGRKKERGVRVGERERLTRGATMGSWDGGRFIKEDGCGGSEYEGENLDE
jgi:hypothetical protein